MRRRSALAKGEIKPLTLNPRITNGVFGIFLRENSGRKTVVKIPKLDSSRASKRFFRLVGTRGKGEYEARLKSIAGDSFLGPHLPRIVSVDKLGGYESEFVTGPNLAEVRLHVYRSLSLLPGLDPSALVAAIRALRTHLDDYRAAGGAPCGDWALHNLVFDIESGAIKNVDLEGFYTYGATDMEASPAFYKGELEGLADLVELAASDAERDKRILAAQSAAWYSTHSGSSYSGTKNFAGYHSMVILGHYFRGQRECRERLAKVPFDFTQKSVLDVGCNAGGMLHALAGTVAVATGIDYDARCINAANIVAAVNGTPNLSFFTLDLEKDDLSQIEVLTIRRKIDICFLLSVCMWIKNWKDVITRLSTFCENMLFESNGSALQQKEQMEFVATCYEQVLLIQEGSPDDPGKKERSLYLCRGSRKLRPSSQEERAASPVAPVATVGPIR
ncbi:MAG TPA: methyltransferase domain-containing protein [Phycisphaerae bacterium]|jgi:SAM-dependent methyltransferase|nr:methyltransferase domain-containing protein [Phycisphaerae bacterium]